MATKGYSQLTRPWCLHCGQSYEGSYRGRCVNKIIQRDKTLVDCPGPLMFLEVEWPAEAKAAAAALRSVA